MFWKEKIKQPREVGNFWGIYTLSEFEVMVCVHMPFNINLEANLTLMKDWKKHSGRDSGRILILMTILYEANSGALDFPQKPTDMQNHLQS